MTEKKTTLFSWNDTSSKGEFQRKPAQFRDSIRADGSSPFLPEKGRYHIYVSLACPWAHRTLIVRALKGLEDVISYSAVAPILREKGWNFDAEHPDHVYGHELIRELYLKANPEYNGRFTVPVLWDKKLQTIVNNESSEIIRMLNSEFEALSSTPGSIDTYPPELREKIDEANAWVYETINNGVYKCGFATTQEAYEEAFDKLFKSLDRVEDILSKQRYLAGDKFTEADIRLFTTLVRFDPVYHGHFKCNGRRIVDYPNMWNYVREIYQMPEVKSTVNLYHIKTHYYASHKSINPTGVVPKGPFINFEEPHDRDTKFPVKA